MSDTGQQARLDNIALSLSGGGVRAVGFHLGTLDMLDQLDLLSGVTILSTVSGGSLTGIGYALSQRHGHTFARFFKGFYDFLPKVNTVELLLDQLGSAASGGPDGHRHLITALANVYDDIYFRSEFGEVVDGVRQTPRFEQLLDPNAPPGHLREVVFNATEFQTGSGFRFQRSEYRCLIGNAQIQICEEHAGKLRIADIMAASSCIPAGMEPMFFPHDFHWPDDRESNRPTCDQIRSSLEKNLHRRFRLYRERKVDHFALMDGGVFDNQGIVSLLLAMNRQATKIARPDRQACSCGATLYEDNQPAGPDQWARWMAGTEAQGAPIDDASLQALLGAHDLIIISDTPVLKDSQYPKIQDEATDMGGHFHRGPAERHRILNRLTIGRLETIGWGLALLLFVSAALNFREDVLLASGWMDSNLLVMAIDVIQIGVPILLMILVGGVVMAARSRLRAVAKSLYSVLPESRWGKHSPWWYMRRLRIGDLADMVRLRIGSVSALAASIFMNRIRELSYSAAYTRLDRGDHIVANQIFALEDAHLTLPDGARPLAADARAIISLAANMATKLWINDIELPATPEARARMSDPLRIATEKVVALNGRRRADGKTLLNDLDVLVICGQLTTCFKIMSHLQAEHRSEDGAWGNAAAKTAFECGLVLWNRAQDDPAILLDERKAGVAPANAA